MQLIKPTRIIYTGPLTVGLPEAIRNVKAAHAASRWEPEVLVLSSETGVARGARCYFDCDRTLAEDCPVSHIVNDADAVVAIWDGMCTHTYGVIRAAVKIGLPVEIFPLLPELKGDKPWQGRLVYGGTGD